MSDRELSRKSPSKRQKAGRTSAEGQRTNTPSIAAYSRARPAVSLKPAAHLSTEDSERDAHRISTEIAPEIQRAAAQESSSIPNGPLPMGIRRAAEESLQTPLDGVGIRTDVAAARSAEFADAHAYAFGKEIVFNAGKYAPETLEGSHLLAHELSHVVSQKTTGPRVERQSRGSDLLRMRQVSAADVIRHPRPFAIEPYIESAIRRWLDQNRASVQGHAVCVIRARVMAAVPLAASLIDFQIDDVILRWSDQTNISVVRIMGAAPACQTREPSAAGPAPSSHPAPDPLAPIRRVVDALMHGVTVRQDPDGRIAISARGLTADYRTGQARIGPTGGTVGLRRGSFAASSSVRWSGSIGLEASYRDLRLSASVDANEWSVSLRYGPRMPNVNPESLGQIMQRANQSMGAAVRVLDSAGRGNFSQAIGLAREQFEPVQNAVEALSGLSGLSEAPSGPRFSAGVTATGPMREETGATPSAPPSIRLNLSVSF